VCGVCKLISDDSFITFVLVVILGTLAAIVYSLRVTVLMERRIARVDQNIERLVKAILKEEIKIERMEEKIYKKVDKNK